MHDFLLLIHALNHLILTADGHPAGALLAIVLVASSGGLFVAAQLAGRALGRAGGAGTIRRRRRRRGRGRETKSHR